MAKSPHTPEFRAKVSQEYLDGVTGSLDKTLWEVRFFCV